MYLSDPSKLSRACVNNSTLITQTLIRTSGPETHGAKVRARAVSAARAAAAGWAAARVTATKAVAPAREGVTVAAVNYAKPKSPFSFLGEAVYPLGEGVIELGWPVRLAGVVHHRDASVFEGRGR